MSCPLRELSERVALGVDLSVEEEGRLHGHDVEGCQDCSSGVTEVAKIDGLMGETYESVGQVLDKRKSSRLREIEEQVRLIELAPPRRLRRLNWRFVLYATNIAAALLLAVNFTALVAILKLRVQGRRDTARTEVRTLTIALATYQRDHGQLPSDAGALVELLSRERTSGTGQVYFRFQVERRKVQGYLDPWGQPYRYEVDAEAPSGFRFWSLGRDGIDDGGHGDDVQIPLVDASAPGPGD